MVTLFIVLLVIACAALSLFILIQNPKGGGLVTGSANTNMFGVQRTGDVLEKGTWVLLGLVVVFSLAITITSQSGTSSSSGSKIDEHINRTAAPAAIGGGAPAQSAPVEKDTTN